MSSLLNNKIGIHIVSEVVVVLGMTLYFSSRIRKLTEIIEDLSQRLEEQEDVIQKHTQLLNRLVKQCSNNGHTQPTPIQPTSNSNFIDQTQPTVTVQQVKDILSSQSKPTLKPVVEKDESDEDESDEDDLDNDIENELAELNED